MEIATRYNIDFSQDEWDCFLDLIVFIKENQSEIGFRRLKLPEHVCEYVDNVHSSMGFPAKTHITIKAEDLRNEQE